MFQPSPTDSSSHPTVVGAPSEIIREYSGDKLTAGGGVGTRDPKGIRTGEKSAAQVAAIISKDAKRREKERSSGEPTEGQKIEATLQKAIDKLLKKRSNMNSNGKRQEQRPSSSSLETYTQRSRVPKMLLDGEHEEGSPILRFSAPELDHSGWLPPFRGSAPIDGDGLHAGWTPLGEVLGQEHA